MAVVVFVKVGCDETVEVKDECAEEKRASLNLEKKAQGT